MKKAPTPEFIKKQRSSNTDDLGVIVKNTLVALGIGVTYEGLPKSPILDDIDAQRQAFEETCTANRSLHFITVPDDGHQYSPRGLMQDLKERLFAFDQGGQMNSRMTGTLNNSMKIFDAVSATIAKMDGADENPTLIKAQQYAATLSSLSEHIVQQMVKEKETGPREQ